MGVKPFINAAGTYTKLTASLMLLEVMEAMQYASGLFVRLQELEAACGARIASLLGCEACMITSGAAAGLTLGTAACMTGTDQDLIRADPDTRGMKHEVLIQKSHRYAFDHAVRNCGAHLVEVVTTEDLKGAVNDRTSMMLFFNDRASQGQITVDEFAALGKALGIPTFNDVAADVPPVDHLARYLRMGYDLVTFSGGKGLRGPQSAGLLLGRKDLIQGARMNASPHEDTIGRGFKVNKEEILGMMVAVEAYLGRDHEADWREWEGRVQRIAEAVKDLPSVRAASFAFPIANHSPHLRLRWDETLLKIRYTEAVQALREGDPSIEVTPDQEGCLVISVWMLKPGEAEIVGRRLRGVLSRTKHPGSVKGRFA